MCLSSSSSLSHPLFLVFLANSLFTDACVYMHTHTHTLESYHSRGEWEWERTVLGDDERVPGKEYYVSIRVTCVNVSSSCVAKREHKNRRGERSCELFSQFVSSPHFRVKLTIERRRKSISITQAVCAKQVFSSRKGVMKRAIIFSDSRITLYTRVHVISSIEVRGAFVLPLSLSVWMCVFASVHSSRNLWPLKHEAWTMLLYQFSLSLPLCNHLLFSASALCCASHCESVTIVAKSTDTNRQAGSVCAMLHPSRNCNSSLLTGRVAQD